MHYQRDGSMSLGQGGSATHYFPNSDDTAPKDQPEYKEPALPLGDVVVDRYDSRQDHDDYTQAGNLYRLMPPDEQERLHKAIAGALGQARPDIQMRQLCHFFRADTDYGRGGGASTRSGHHGDRIEAGGGCHGPGLGRCEQVAKTRPGSV